MPALWANCRFVRNVIGTLWAFRERHKKNDVVETGIGCGATENVQEGQLPARHAPCAYLVFCAAADRATPWLSAGRSQHHEATSRCVRRSCSGVSPVGTSEPRRELQT